MRRGAHDKARDVEPSSRTASARSKVSGLMEELGASVDEAKAARRRAVNVEAPDGSITVNDPDGPTASADAYLVSRAEREAMQARRRAR